MWLRTGNYVHVRMMLVILLLLLTSFSFSSKDFKALNEEADDKTFFLGFSVVGWYGKDDVLTSRVKDHLLITFFLRAYYGGMMLYSIKT